MSERIELEVIGGLCRLEFTLGSSTGTDEDTRPGVGFALVSEAAPMTHGALYYSGSGVIGRQDCERLRDALEIFLKSCARGEQKD